MFRVTVCFRGKERSETAGTLSEALTWVEEFRYLGATDISVTDDARVYELDDLPGLVQILQGNPSRI